MLATVQSSIHYKTIQDFRLADNAWLFPSRHHSSLNLSQFEFDYSENRGMKTACHSTTPTHQNYELILQTLSLAIGVFFFQYRTTNILSSDPFSPYNIA